MLKNGKLCIEKTLHFAWMLGVTDAEAKFFNGVEGLRAHNMNMQSWVSPEKT